MSVAGGSRANGGKRRHLKRATFEVTLKAAPHGACYLAKQQGEATMSEFSDSVHLFAVSAEAAAQVLKKAGGGIVLASNGRATSLLLPWERKPALLESQPGYALDYSYGGDHGLWLRFYKDGLCRAKLELSWDDMELPEDEPEPEVSPNLVDFLSGLLGEQAAQRVKAIADQLAEAEWEARDGLIDELGALLGLPAFRWVGCEHIDRADLGAFPAAVRVPATE
jgi:hypothetical protein